MLGYKGMSKDMTCRGMQFEIGKTNRVDGEIKLCENGLHFCKNLVDVFSFYEREDGNRFFEVETDAPVFSDEKKSVTSELTVIRELTDIEVNRALYSLGTGIGHVYGNGCGFGCGYGYFDSGDGFGNGCGYKINIQRILVFN